MGLLNFIFGKTDSGKIEKDLRKPECPYCFGLLSKIPGSKTKCPHCKQFIFVRTRPKDNARVTVTKQQVEEIEEQWSIVNGTHDIYLQQKKEREDTKRKLKENFGGKEPSENDVSWSLLNKKALEHLQNGDFGLYRCVKFEMGEILRKENRLNGALRKYLEICYIDLNGPVNTSGLSSLGPEYCPAPFNPCSNAFLAPGIIERIIRIQKKTKINTDELETIFIDHCKKYKPL